METFKKTRRRVRRFSLGLFTWGEEDPSTTNILEGGTTFRWVYMQNVGLCGYQVKQELKNASDNNKHAI